MLLSYCTCSPPPSSPPLHVQPSNEAVVATNGLEYAIDMVKYEQRHGGGYSVGSEYDPTAMYTPVYNAIPFTSSLFFAFVVPEQNIIKFDSVTPDYAIHAFSFLQLYEGHTSTLQEPKWRQTPDVLEGSSASCLICTQ